MQVSKTVAYNTMSTRSKILPQTLLSCRIYTYSSRPNLNVYLYLYANYLWVVFKLLPMGWL